LPTAADTIGGARTGGLQELRRLGLLEAALVCSLRTDDILYAMRLTSEARSSVVDYAIVDWR
jgi:hypothetical protein